MGKVKSTVTNPALQHRGITSNPIMAIITLQNELAQNPKRYDVKELKAILEDILDTLDRMMNDSSSNNKNASMSRQYAEQYNWVAERLTALK